MEMIETHHTHHQDDSSVMDSGAGPALLHDGSPVARRAEELIREATAIQVKLRMTAKVDLAEIEDLANRLDGLPLFGANIPGEKRIRRMVEKRFSDKGLSDKSRIASAYLGAIAVRKLAARALHSSEQNAVPTIRRAEDLLSYVKWLERNFSRY